ncbi:MAG: hypothetical protein AAFQ22_07145 [Pseudomonadota bacterium]
MGGMQSFLQGAQVGGQMRQRRQQSAMGQLLQKGNLPKAQAMAAQMGDTDAMSQIQGMLDSADDQQRAQVAARAELVASHLQPLLSLPPQERENHRKRLAQVAAQNGFDPQAVSSLDLSDASINGIVNQAMGLKERAAARGFTEMGDQMVMTDKVSGSAAPAYTRGPSFSEETARMNAEQPSYATATTADGVIAYDKSDPNSTVNLGATPPPRSAANVTVNNIPASGAGAQTSAQEAYDKQLATRVAEWNTGGGADVMKNIGQLRTVQERLERVASGQDSGDLSGPLLGMVPPNMRILFNEGSVDTQQLLEEVVQRNLRLILGAQFTAQEGERLIARAYNPQASEKVNAARVAALLRQMEIAGAQMQGLSDRLNDQGTFIGYDVAPPSLQSFYSAIDSANAPEPSGQQGLELPVVQDQAGYDAIQPGQEYMDPNGVRRRKP